jgi:hypothetical protein
MSLINNMIHEELSGIDVGLHHVIMEYIAGWVGGVGSAMSALASTRPSTKRLCPHFCHNRNNTPWRWVGGIKDDHVHGPIAGNSHTLSGKSDQV